MRFPRTSNAKSQSIRMSLTPLAAGYHMPAEWEPHSATWIAWPHNHRDWPGKFPPIPWVYTEIVRHLSASENVCILVSDEEAKRRVQRQLQKANAVRGEVRFYCITTDRSWTRDYAPTFILNKKTGQVGAVKWAFNGWAKYNNHKQDDAAGMRISRLSKVPTWEPRKEDGSRVVLEGGSFDVNGKGLLLTTRECLLSEVQARNPGFTQADYENLFRNYLGVQKVIWLNQGIEGDDTHGHVDDIARFVSADTVVVVSESDKDDPNFEPLRENLKILRSVSDLRGRKLNVVTLPMPAPIVFDGQRLPASYANFYIANRVVLVPTFNDPNDRVALSRLQRLFPDRLVVGICCVDLVLGLGTLHCLTQQQVANPKLSHSN